MGLTSLLSSVRAGETAGQVQMAVAAKMLKMANAQGEAAVQMVEDAAALMGQAASVNPDLGGNLDLLA